MLASLTPLVAAAVPARIGEWLLEPGVLAPLLVSVVLYVVGFRALQSRCGRRVVHRWRAAAFGAGCAAVAIALLSPVDTISEQLFSMHMVQHELLMVVAAPLLIAGQPLLVMLWAFPLRTRRRLGGLARRRPIRVVWETLSRPFDAWLLHGLAIWCWHVPVLFQAALRNDAIHALQHLSFLGSALLFWWAIFRPKRRASLGLSVVYLFTTTVHTAVLGALITFAHSPWYPAYGTGAAVWGLTPLDDQQLAGLIMWIPAGLVYLVAALIIMRRWMRESEWSVVRDEAWAA